MRLLFVVSGLLWSFLVGRLIAFGPTMRSLSWCPHMDADSWYRLTEIPCKLPHTIFALLPSLIIACSIPALYIPDDALHVVAVVTHVSEHAFIPVFVAQIHHPLGMACWALCNAISNMSVTLIYLGHPWVMLMGVGLWLKCVLHMWFVYIELFVHYRTIIREPPGYESRHPRVMTV